MLLHVRLVTVFRSVLSWCFSIKASMLFEKVRKTDDGDLSSILLAVSQRNGGKRRKGRWIKRCAFESGASVMSNRSLSSMDESRVKVGVSMVIVSKMLSISMMTGIDFSRFRPFRATRIGSLDQFLLPMSVMLWMNWIDFDTDE